MFTNSLLMQLFCYFFLIITTSFIATIYIYIYIYILQNPFTRMDDVDPVILAVFIASYMRKLGGEQKRFCR